jgi:hypothetical protein
MAGRISCTCGCGLEVTYATKQNHLRARGTTSLRSRVTIETKSLNRNKRQQQKPTPLLHSGLKKRASSNSDQDGSRKRHKPAQLEENELPEISDNSQVDADLIENLLPPIATDTDRQSMFIERSRGMMEMRWTTSRRDGGPHSDGKGSDNAGRDDEEDEDKDGDEEDEDGDEEDGDGDEEDGDGDEEDGDGDEEDEDEDEPLFYDTEILGISDWDLLGEDFEREAAAIGLYSSCMNYLPS